MLALAVAVAAACSGDKVPRQVVPSATSSSATTPRPLPTASDDRLHRALLSVDDLGGSWQQQSVQDAGGTVADTYYCGKKLESLNPDAVAVFVTPSKQGLLIMVETISQFKDPAAAQAALDELDRAHTGCVDWTSTDGVQKTDWHTESFTSADIGDQSFVDKATGQLEGLPERSTSVSVEVRRGDTVLTVVMVAPGDLPVAEGLGIATKALSRYVSTLDQ